MEKGVEILEWTSRKDYNNRIIRDHNRRKTGGGFVMLHNYFIKAGNRGSIKAAIQCLFFLCLAGMVSQSVGAQTVFTGTISMSRKFQGKQAGYPADEKEGPAVVTPGPGDLPVITEPPAMSAEPVPTEPALTEPTPEVSAEPPQATDGNSGKELDGTSVPRTFPLRLKQNGKKIQLTWKRVSGAVSYQVDQKKNNNKYKKYKSTRKKKVRFRYSYGKKYKIRVMAYDNRKHCIGISREYAFYVPKQPTRIHIVYQNSKTAKISWKKVPEADYYLIYRRSGKGSAKLIRQTKKCEFTNRNLSSDHTYQYQIQAVYRAGKQKFTGKAGKQSYDNHKIVATDHQKYSYAEMADDIVRLSRKYPGIVHYNVIGKSEDGRNLYEVTVGNRSASRSILVVSALHAREYMASLLCMNQIEYYARNYREEIDSRKVSDVFNRVCVRYIPMANPDGVMISQQGISQIRSKKLQKKLKKISKGTNTALWKANARGVDLNDNFPYEFQVKGKAGSQGYSGVRPANSREAGAIVRRIKALKGYHLKAVVNYHAMGSVIYGSCHREGFANAANTDRMYQTAREVTGYSSAGNNGSHNGGGLREYVMYHLQLPSITLEVGRHTCPGPISEFPAIWRENADLIFKEAALFY